MAEACGCLFIAKSRHWQRLEKGPFVCALARLTASGHQANARAARVCSIQPIALISSKMASARSISSVAQFVTAPYTFSSVVKSLLRHDRRAHLVDRPVLRPEARCQGSQRRRSLTEAHAVYP